MRKLLFSLHILISSVANAGTQPVHHPSLVQFLKDHLPARLAQLEPGKTTEKEVTLLLGKAKETDQTTLYYDINGIRYDLSIEVEKGILKSFAYDFPVSNSGGKSLDFHQFGKWITAEKTKQIFKELDAQKGHERGRFFEVKFPEEGLVLKFKNIKPKKLNQIRYTTKIVSQHP